MSIPKEWDDILSFCVSCHWYTLYNAVRTICRTPPLHKIACAKKIKSVGIRPRCVRVNHTWRSGQFCRFFFSFTMSRSQASSTSSSAPSWLQEFISAVTTQTNLAREHAARSDRTIEDLMERLDKQELRHQQVVDALQKQVAAAGATPLPGAAPSSSLPTSQPYGRLPSPPPLVLGPIRKLWLPFPNRAGQGLID